MILGERPNCTDDWHALPTAIHALNVSVVVTALAPIDTGARSGGASHGSEQQPGSRTNACTLIPADRGPRHRANHGTHRSISHRIVIGSLIRADAADLSTGITPAQVVINAKLIKALSGAWQRQNAGTGRQTRATCRRENSPGEHDQSQLKLHDLNILQKKDVYCFSTCGEVTCGATGGGATAEGASTWGETSCQGLAHCATVG